MRVLWRDKDDGQDSKVLCYGIESKILGSVLVLSFGQGSREAFHSHAFNSWSWVLKGWLKEIRLVRETVGETDFLIVEHEPSFRPIRTFRDTVHMVLGMSPMSWVLTVRGPWLDTWREYLPKLKRWITLTHGRKEV